MLTATNGTDALRLARSTPKIDLLISNIEMPGMNGDELAGRFAPIHPEASVLYTSSFGRTVNGSEPASLLAKPFTVADLRLAVSRALRARPVLAETSHAA